MRYPFAEPGYGSSPIRFGYGGDILLSLGSLSGWKIPKEGNDILQLSPIWL